MESGNSGSMQSSSGGDEEYDSRAESISPFLNPPPAHIGQPPPRHHHLHSTTTTTSKPMFDPFSNYFDPTPRPPQPPFSNLEHVWSKTVRSEPNCTEINPVLTQQPLFASQQQQQQRAPPTVPFHPVPTNAGGGTPNPHQRASTTTATHDQSNQLAAPPRNPKKRSRASRRAPTTVLTTDTTNFRAMVQEFTGIPAPPFAINRGGRLDLFGAMRRSNLSLDPSLHQHLLRPFALKPQPPPPPLPPTVITSGSSNPSSFVNLQNSILTVQSLLQPKYPQPDSKAQDQSFEIPSNGSRVGIFDDQFGFSDQGGHFNGCSNYDFSGSPINATPTTNNNIKLNYSASSSSSTFHAEKGGEGMVDSWICSSD